MITKSVIAALMLIMGALQAWDSNVLQAGILIILMVSVAILIPAILFLLLPKPPYLIGSILLSLALLLVARLISPVPLSGLFLVLLPAAMGFIYVGLLENRIKTD
jgi:hypothetical protein